MHPRNEKLQTLHAVKHALHTDEFLNELPALAEAKPVKMVSECSAYLANARAWVMHFSSWANLPFLWHTGYGVRLPLNLPTIQPHRPIHAAESTPTPDLRGYSALRRSWGSASHPAALCQRTAPIKCSGSLGTSFR